MDGVSLVLAAASPVVEAALLAGVGALLAHKGVMDEGGRRTCAKLCFHVLIPALTFAKLGAAVSVAALKEMWPLLVNLSLSCVCGLATGAATAWATRCPREFRRLIIAACAFGNVGNLPLVFAADLCDDPAGLFARALGGPARCAERGVAYIMFNALVATLLQFSVGVWLLRPPRGEAAAPGEDTPLKAASKAGGGAELSSVRIAARASLELQPWSLEDDDGGAGSPAPASTPPPPPARGEDSDWLLLGTGSKAGERRGARALAAAAWRRLDPSSAPMPVVAALAAMLVGCTPWLKRLFFGGARPPLHVVAQALTTLGDGLVPLALLLIGAVLSAGARHSQLPRRVLAGVVATRLVLQPALLTLGAVAALRLRLFSAPDPLFLLTLLVSNATPSAVNLQTLTVLYRRGEAEMSTLLLWQYCASLLTLPAVTWCALQIIIAAGEVT